MPSVRGYIDNPGHYWIEPAKPSVPRTPPLAALRLPDAIVPSSDGQTHQEFPPSSLAR